MQKPGVNVNAYPLYMLRQDLFLGIKQKVAFLLDWLASLLWESSYLYLHSVVITGRSQGPSGF